MVKIRPGTEGARTQSPAKCVVILQNLPRFVYPSLLHFHGLCLNKLSIIFWTVEHLHQCCEQTCCRVMWMDVCCDGGWDIFTGCSLSSQDRIKLSLPLCSSSQNRHNHNTHMQTVIGSDLSPSSQQKFDAQVTSYPVEYIKLDISLI